MGGSGRPADADSADRHDDSKRAVSFFRRFFPDRYGHERVTDLQREMELKTNSQITDAVTQSNSYTDKRIDKLIDAYFITNEAKKQK